MFFSACQRDEASSLQGTTFAFVGAEQSGLHFSNDIEESDTLNYYTFPYLYMGGGVAIGDINNDGLQDIYVTGNMVPNKLYLNKGGLQFEDISDQAGVSGDDRWYTGVTMADVNNDGWLDIYVCVSGQYAPFQNQLFINNKDNTFTERAEEYGIDDASTSIQATFFDYDLDGHLDVFVGNYPQIKVSMGNQYYYQKIQANEYEESGHLYKNNGDGTFTDVTIQAGLQNFGLTLGLIASDLNQDGYIDLYLSNDFIVPDYCYLNNGDGTFREVSQSTTRHTSMFGMGVDAADFNNDGLLDFGQVDMTPEDYKRAKTNMASMSPASFQEAVDLGFHHQYMQNSIQLNNGITKEGLPIFSDIARYTGMALTDWSWGIMFADLDNDGRKDVFISNGMKRDVNNNDALAEVAANSIFGGTNPLFSDLPSEPIPNYAFKNQGALQFENKTIAWGLDTKGFTNGFSTGDLDQDGDLDLVLNNLGGKLSLWENKTNTLGQHFLQVNFKGTKQNPLGIGAKVELETSSQKQSQELTLTRGFQSSVPPILHFGLGNHPSVTKLKVIWPDGKKQILQDVEANQQITLFYRDAYPGEEPVSLTSVKFQSVVQAAGINFKHVEDNYDDYKFELLLPHQYSRFGPPVAVSDVNQDGLDDFFVGNATGSSAQLYLQHPDGTFETGKGPWQGDAQNFEDTGALFFDADQDGDQDLYVVNGGNDPTQSPGFYQDRLYLNQNGTFIQSNGLPEISFSGKVVSAYDYDQDGDLDLFVGGTCSAWKIPPSSSQFFTSKQWR